MKTFYSTIILFLILALSPNASASSFIYCDDCNDNKAKFKAITSQLEGEIDVGDIETGIVRSFNVVERSRFGEFIVSATSISTDSATLTKFNNVYISYHALKSKVYSTSGIIETPWEALQSPYLGTQVVNMVINNNTSLYQQYTQYYNQGALLTNLTKPVDLRISTPDGGYLMWKATGVAFDGQTTLVVGAFDFENSVDGNGNPIVAIIPSQRYGFSGTGQSAYNVFTSYMSGMYGWSWAAGSGGGSGSGGGTTMTCFKSGGGVVCVITLTQ